ncbi:MAG: hypothetical protein M1837_006693 [Sclerophora amabilis]|nr:MAG: hypothetical protein M1837_006693 [Sclerophora amabilis]
MEDPNLIATLIPADQNEFARSVFRLRENRRRYSAPTRCIPDNPTISSRETTPAGGQFDEGGGEYDSLHRILLRFKEKEVDLKNPATGIAFGTDPKKCDVFLGPRGPGGISGLHFCITFDDAGNIYLKDSSTWGTAVSYSGQAEDEVRRHFTWRLNHEKDKGDWDIQVHVPTKRGLCFKVKLATHNTCGEEYRHNVYKFLEAGRNALPSVNALGIKSYETTEPPSQSFSPKQRPVYLRDQELGSGTFGSVYKIIDASTGFTFAGKYFHRRSQRTNSDWLETIRREIRIMSSIAHEHIVHALDSTETPMPLLVMPYFALGNLDDQHGIAPITFSETISLLYQSLQALEYLHSCRVDRRRIAHRDIKPANVIVVSRFPFHIKLADFGLAQDRSDLMTCCGTLHYLAPEVQSNKAYTTAVDIWSLGVVVLQYAYGFPEDSQYYHRPKNTRARSWCLRIVDEIKRGNSDPLRDLLYGHMLRIDPKERLHAGQCLEKGSEIGLFDGPVSAIGYATPTQQTAPNVLANNEDGSTTIVMEGIWGTQTSSDNHEDVRTYQDAEIKLRLGAADAQSKCSRIHKRPRLSTKGSIKGSSSRVRIKGRQTNLDSKARSVSHTPAISHLDRNGETIQHQTTYDFVLALLKNLHLGDGVDPQVDDHTFTMLEDLCEYFTELDITDVMVTLDDAADCVSVTAISKGREFDLMSLTTSERKSSISELAAHLAHMMHFHGVHSPSASTASVDNSLSQENWPAMNPRSVSWAESIGNRRGTTESIIITDVHGDFTADSIDTAVDLARGSIPESNDNLSGTSGSVATTDAHGDFTAVSTATADSSPFRRGCAAQDNQSSWATDGDNSQTSTMTAQRYGLTFPSGLLDVLEYSSPHEI